VENQQNRLSSGLSLGRIGLALALAGLASASGCATSQSEVPVIHSRAAVTAIGRAYLVVFQGQRDADSAEKVRQALTDALQPRTAALVSLLVTGLDLDDPNALTDIDTFGPDGIILVKPTGEVTHQEGGAESVTYDVVVKAPKEKRVVWHANLVSESGPEVMARDLVDNLTAAGLLSRDEPPVGKKPERSK
jgi:hypothetical protein